ncbi:MAG: hypothetical protein IJM50_02755 [Lachnospiraceae bacterium]|nr:hypothetical protein [Lachnospiraceae bacterium]
MKQLKSLFKDSPIKFYDWIILFAVTIFCFFGYEMAVDLYHTAGCSYGLLNGHILDFYDYVAANGVGVDGSAGLHASYLPTIYILFAIWNLPMKLFGAVTMPTAMLGFIPIMWAKILPCLFYVAGGFVVFLIAKELGMGETKSKVCMFAYLTVPAALLSQFLFGQYESIVMFFVLLGFYWWLKRKNWLFVLFFMIAFSLKYTVIVAFFPLLLLREKKILRILIDTVLLLPLTALFMLIYRRSPMFNAYVFGFGSTGDNPIGYLFNVSYATGYSLSNIQFVTYPLVLAFIVLLGFCYFKKCQNAVSEKRYAVFFVSLAFSVFFVLIKWHQQWLLLAIPFWLFSAFLLKEVKIWLFLEGVFAAILIAFCVLAFPNGLDDVVIENGALKFLLFRNNFHLSNALNMKEFFSFVPVSLALSLLGGLILLFGIFKHPKYMEEDHTYLPANTMLWTRVRMAAILLFIIPSLLCVFRTMDPPNAAYIEDGRDVIITMSGNETLTQPFTSYGTKISKIKFPVALRQGYEDATIVVTVKDPFDRVLYEKAIRAASLYDAELVILKPGIKVTEGIKYSVNFDVYGAKDPDSVGLLGVFDKSIYKNALMNGKETDFHMEMDIYQ